MIPIQQQTSAYKLTIGDKFQVFQREYQKGRVTYDVQCTKTGTWHCTGMSLDRVLDLAKQEATQ